MTRKRKKNFRSAILRKKTRRIDYITLLLIAISFIFMILIIFFILRTRTISFQETESSQNPVIERHSNPPPPIAQPDPTVERISPDEAEHIVEQIDESPPVSAAQVQVRLFFIKVVDEKKIISKSVLRSVPSSQSPMTVTLTALLEGPKAGELNNDIFTLIPKNSKLIGARVEGGIAYLDFNEDFRFNSLGIDGYKAQTEQIVYTSTEFSTVSKVQFLVEGQRIGFLGGEGFWIGEPLGREDFE